MSDWRKEELTAEERARIAERERIDPELVDWSVLGEADRCEVLSARLEALFEAADDETRAALAPEREALLARAERLYEDDAGESGWFDEIRELVAKDDPQRRAAMAEQSEILKRALEIVEGLKGRPGRKGWGTPEEVAARKKVYMQAYRQARRDGTWVPKKELGKGGRVLCMDPDEAAQEAHRASLEAARAGRAQRAAEAAEAARRAAEAKRLEAEDAERKGAAEDRRLAERELARQAAVRRGMGKPAQGAEADARDLAELTAVFRERRHVLAEAERVAEPFFEEEREAQRKRREEYKATPEYQEYLKEREAKRKEVFETYGYQVGKWYKRMTPKRLEGKHQYELFLMSWRRKRRHDHITSYNREYRRRKRAEALREEQKTWTAEQWAAWNEKQRRKTMGEGTNAGFVKGVVAFLAKAGTMSEDEILARLFEAGAMEFLQRGYASLGRAKARGGMVAAAARAVAFFIDPESSVMFAPDTGKRKKPVEGESPSGGTLKPA